MSSDTPSFIDEPESLILVALVSTPEVPSKTWQTTPSISDTYFYVGLEQAYLYNGFLAGNFQDLTGSMLAIWELQADDFVVLRKLTGHASIAQQTSTVSVSVIVVAHLDVVQHDQWTERAKDISESVPRSMIVILIHPFTAATV
jgi:hypothetical protein